MSSQKRGSSKAYKFGGKQKHGSSRVGYFNRRKMGLAAANKARRIAKDAKLKAVE